MTSYNGIGSSFKQTVLLQMIRNAQRFKDVHLWMKCNLYLFYMYYILLNFFNYYFTNVWFNQLNKPTYTNDNSYYTQDLSELSFYQGFSFYTSNEQWIIKLAKMIGDQNELAKYLFDPLMPQNLINCKYKENSKSYWVTVLDYDEDKDMFTVVDDNANPEQINLFSERGYKEWEQPFDFY